MARETATTEQQALPVMRGGATVWCINEHGPTLIASRHGEGDAQGCPECGAQYDVEVSVSEAEA